MNNSQEIIQPSETSFHIRSAKFLCRPCNRQFSSVNPENGRAACPRCESYSNVMLQDAQQSAIQTADLSTQQTSSQQQQQQTQSQPQQSRNMSFIRQTIYRPGQTIIIQTMVPEMQVNDQQTNQNTGFNFANMFNGLAGAFGGFNQQSNQTGNPSDLFGEANQQPQQPQPQQFQQGFAPSPFDFFFLPTPMMFFNTNDYERIIQEFLRNDPNNYGPAPASDQSINSLKNFEYNTGACKNTECSICQDEYKAGDKCVALPCEHNYHKDCVVEWLTRHDSCPICRKSISKQANTDKMEEEIPQPQRQQSSC